MNLRFPLYLMATIGLSGTAFADQAPKPSSSELMEKCGDYKILLEPVEKGEVGRSKFPRTVKIVTDRIRRHTGAAVVNFVGAQAAEIRFPNTKSWSIYSGKAFDLVVTTKGDFGIYEVVGRGEAGQYDGSDTVLSLQDFVKEDIHWYVSKDPLIESRHIRDATVNLKQGDDGGEVHTIDLHLVKHETRTVQDFSDRVAENLGSPMLAALDGRALKSIMFTDIDTEKPINFNPGFVPEYVQAFSSVIAHRTLPIAVKYQKLSSSRPKDGVKDCPILY
jgi:hypothetical protein